MEADDLTVDDVESTILTGRVIERQRDFRSGEWKYCVAGQSVGEDAVTVVVKFTPAMSMAAVRRSGRARPG